jgi:hypothetical protein
LSVTIDCVPKTNISKTEQPQVHIAKILTGHRKAIVYMCVMNAALSKTQNSRAHFCLKEWSSTDMQQGSFCRQQECSNLHCFAAFLSSQAFFPLISVLPPDSWLVCNPGHEPMMLTVTNLHNIDGLGLCAEIARPFLVQK